MRFLISLIVSWALVADLSAQQVLPAIGSVQGSGGGGGGATFVNATSCVEGSTGNTVTCSGLSIPSGDIIVCGVVGASGGSQSCADSNSDSSTCGGYYAETNGFALGGCVLKAGATITSVTCSETFSSFAVNCLVSWYTAGGLSGVIDKETGQDQAGVLTWTTGNTATLTGSTDLVVGLWATEATGTTSTYSDGGTQRVLRNTGSFAAALEDRNVSGTSAVAASGQFSASGTFASVAVMAIK